MRTIYGKLVALIFATLAALLLFLPMRSGLEDHLYAYPRNLRMARGDSYQITCKLDSDHAQAIAYSAVDDTVAQVSPQGRVTAMNPGTTDIHMAAEGGARTTMHIEVVGTPTTRLLLNTDSLAMEKGQVTGLRASFNDGADDTRIEWYSADPEIARVDSAGRVTALRGGRTTITAAAPNGLIAQADVSVHVSGDRVRLTPEALTVGTGASLKMGATFFPDDATDPVDHWVTSDQSLLTVDPDGVIHAMGVGRPVLTVFTQEGLSDSAVIRVEPAAERFDLSPTAVTIERGDEIDLETRFLDADGRPDAGASRHYVAWNSDHPEIAAVKDGHVTGLKSGEAVITASADGMTAQCALRVQVLVHEVTLDQTEVWLLREQANKPIQLKARISPADPDDPTITWLTSNDLVATVDENGLVTPANRYGTAVITARAASGAEAHFTINVVVKLPEEEAPEEHK